MNKFTNLNWGQGNATCFVEFNPITGQIVPFVASSETVESFGGFQYYKSRSGLSGAGRIPNSPFILEVGSYRPDCLYSHPINPPQEIGGMNIYIPRTGMGNLIVKRDNILNDYFPCIWEVEQDNFFLQRQSVCPEAGDQVVKKIVYYIWCESVSTFGKVTKKVSVQKGLKKWQHFFNDGKNPKNNKIGESLIPQLGIRKINTAEGLRYFRVDNARITTVGETLESVLPSYAKIIKDVVVWGDLYNGYYAVSPAQYGEWTSPVWGWVALMEAVRNPQSILPLADEWEELFDDDTEEE